MSRDRWAALAMWVLGATVLVVSIAVSDSEAIVTHDEAAFAELVERLAAGEQSDWIVSYEYVRTLPDGRTSGAEVTEARVGDLHVVRDPTSATAETNERAFTCVVTEAEVQCLERTVVEALSMSEVVRAAVESGAYVVTRLPSVRIAGEDADCYRVFGARGYLPTLGAEGQFCLTADGIQLLTRVVTINGSDERTATTVTRDPDRAAVETLVADLELVVAAQREAEG